MTPCEPHPSGYQELRDPLTGQVSLHSSAHGKPLPAIGRQLPGLRTPCALCLLGASSGAQTWDGEVYRDLLDERPGCIAVPNRWPVFGEDSVGEMVLPRRHAEHLAELTEQEMAGFLELLVTRTASALASHATAYGFLNVGIAAGSSQPHLHGQVHAVRRTPTEALARIRDLGGLGSDIATAVMSDLVLRAHDDAVVWVPHAPFAPVEIRIYATFSEAPGALLTVLRHAEARLGPLPYNVLCHPFDSQVLLQWLPRVDLGPVIPWMCGAVLVQQPPAQIAELLRP